MKYVNSKKMTSYLAEPIASLRILCAPISCNSCMLYGDRLKTTEVNLHKESIFLWSENSRIFLKISFTSIR